MGQIANKGFTIKEDGTIVRIDEMKRKLSSDNGGVDNNMIANDSAIFIISALFLISLYSTAIVMTSKGPFLRLVDNACVIPSITFVCIAIGLWLAKRNVNAMLVMWNFAALWMAVYYILYEYNILTIFGDYNNIYELIGVIAVVFIPFYFWKKSGNETIAPIMAITSAILYLNPITSSFLHGGVIFFSVISIIQIVAIGLVAVKLWNKKSPIKMMFIISSILAGGDAIEICIEIYFYNIGSYWALFDLLMVKSVVYAIVAILLVIAWRLPNKNENEQKFIFFIVLLLCMIALLSEEYLPDFSVSYDSEVFIFDHYIMRFFKNYAARYIFITVHLYSYFMLPLYDKKSLVGK